MSVAAPLFGPGVRTAEMDPKLAAGPLFPIEEVAVARAVASRRREFAAGRLCARRAMGELGHPAVAVPQNGDRSPAWPDGLVGSITHTDSWCAVAVARTSDGYRALGLDIEPAQGLPDDLVDSVCTADERAWLDGQPGQDRALLARAVFSAKECAYKCQYGLSGELLEFDAFGVRLDRTSESFVAVFRQDVCPFAAGDELRGRFRVRNGFIACAIELIDTDISRTRQPTRNVGESQQCEPRAMAEERECR